MPDNITSRSKLRLIDLISEGPIEGFAPVTGITGNYNTGLLPYKSIYFDNTAIISDNLTINYPFTGQNGLSFTLGTEDQYTIPGFENIELPIPLPSDTEVFYKENGSRKDVIVSFNSKDYPEASYLNINMKFPAIYSVTDKGDLNFQSFAFSLQTAVNNSNWIEHGQTVIRNKTTEPYYKTVTLSLEHLEPYLLPTNNIYRIKVLRDDLMVDSTRVQYRSFVDSIVVGQKTKLRYPNSVLMAWNLDSDQFSSVPARAYHIKGLKVKIPNNYNPITRTYNGIWDGTFDSNPEGSNEISNGDFSSGTTSWIAFRSTLSTSSSSPQSPSPPYGVVTVNTGAGDDPTRFSAYQSPGITSNGKYIMRGYYRVSNPNLYLKVGINGDISKFSIVGNSTVWRYFTVEVDVFSLGDWVEFTAQRANACQAGDELYLDAIEVVRKASDGKQWTDNPAWIFYDLLTNPRYGLGNYLKEEWVDKWTLYEIAQYCDEMVDDGNGGSEPRFTCNVSVNSEEDAYNLLQKFVSVFRGMIYWANGRIFVSQDSDKNAVYNFTNANVIDGQFNYASSAQKTRHTVAIVRWRDPDNLYKESNLVIEDTEGLVKYGYQETEVLAFGCTSKGQASRLGKWILTTERLLTETVSFRTGLEGYYIRPGDIINIFDNFRLNKQQGGRVRGFDPTRSQIQIDRSINIENGFKYNLSIVTPTGNLEGTGEITNSSQIPDIRKSQLTTITLTNPTGNNVSLLFASGSYPSTLYTGAIWIIDAYNTNLETGSIRPSRYKILGARESAPSQVEILALDYNTGKYPFIETGYNIITVPVTDPITGSIVGTPSGLSFELDRNIPDTGLFLNIKWSGIDSPYFIYYKISGKVDNTGNWELVDQTPSTGTIKDFSSLISGWSDLDYSFNYHVNIFSVDTNNNFATPLSGYSPISPFLHTIFPLKDLKIIENFDPDVRTTGYIGKTPTFSWELNTSGIPLSNKYFIDSFDVRFATPDSSQYLTPYIDPYGGSGIFIEDNNVFTYTVPTGLIESFTGGERRDFTFIVRLNDSTYTGQKSFISGVFNNNPLTIIDVNTITLSTGQNSINYNITWDNQKDQSGIIFWHSSGDFTPSFNSYQYESKNFGGNFPVNYPANYVYFSPIDTFGKSGSYIYGPYYVDMFDRSPPSAPQNVTGYDPFLNESGIVPGKRVNGVLMYGAKIWWDVVTGEGVQNYDIIVKFPTGAPLSGDKPDYQVPHPQNFYEYYSFQLSPQFSWVRSADSNGNVSPWSKGPNMNTILRLPYQTTEVDYITLSAPLKAKIDSIESGGASGDFLNLSMYLGAPLDTGRVIEAMLGNAFTATGYMVSCITTGNQNMPGNFYYSDLDNSNITNIATFSLPSNTFSIISQISGIPISARKKIGVNLSGFPDEIDGVSFGLYGYKVT